MLSLLMTIEPIYGEETLVFGPQRRWRAPYGKAISPKTLGDDFEGHHLGCRGSPRAVLRTGDQRSRCGRSPGGSGAMFVP
ncbi:MAG: hypothetical protein ACXAEI_09960 [Candidatus Hodarchaeales archaeon]|jgi:hypothetical protein